MATYDNDPNHPFAFQPTGPIEFHLSYRIMVRNGEANAIIQRSSVGPKRVLSLRDGSQTYCPVPSATL